MSEMAGLDELARTQFGLVSRAQAIGKGLAPGAIRWRLDRKEWEHFGRNVYRFRATTETWSQYAMGALLFAGPASALSHHTAAFLFGLDGFSSKKKEPPKIIDLVTPIGAKIERNGVRHHRSHDVPVPVEIVRGLRCTTLARTLVDLSRVLGPRSMDIALDSARRLRPTLAEELRTYVATISARRRGLPELMQLLDSRESSLDSPLEVDALREILARGLPRPTSGYSVYDKGRYVMKIDLAWKDQLVALHLDGYQHHQQREQFERDAAQRTALAGIGWKNVIVTSRSLRGPAWSDALKRLLLP